MLENLKTFNNSLPINLFFCYITIEKNIDVESFFIFITSFYSVDKFVNFKFSGPKYILEQSCTKMYMLHYFLLHYTPCRSSFLLFCNLTSRDSKQIDLVYWKIKSLETHKAFGLGTILLIGTSNTIILEGWPFDSLQIKM